MELRPHQIQSVGEIRVAFRNGSKAALYVCPTGGGKTVTFTFMSKSSVERGNDVLILVHRKELLKQSIKTMHAFGIHVGAIHSKYRFDPTAGVQVASVQTLVGRLNKLPIDPKLIVIDEAHHATAKSYRTIIDYYPNARLVGVTATPIRLDGTGLGVLGGGVFDAMVIGPQIHELQEDGFLCAVRYHTPKQAIDLSSVHIVRGEYDRSEQAEILGKAGIIGDVITNYKKLAENKRTVVFCVNVTHAEQVAETFRANGYRAESVDGSLPDDERERRINGLADGSVQVLTSCDLIGEGLDIPVIDCVVLLRKVRSVSLVLQQIGRGLRPVYSDGFDMATREGRLASIAASDKQYCTVIDHVGIYEAHQDYVSALLTDAPISWSLEGKRKRANEKNDEEKAEKVKQCENCFMVFAVAGSGLKCPHCGHVHKQKGDVFESVEGELIELTPEIIEANKREKKKEVAAARDLADLQKIESARGYKRGWAKHVFLSRQKKQTNG